MVWEETSMFYNFTLILEKDEEEMYTVTVPALSGCVTQGKTKEEAMERAREAIEVTLEGFLALGKPLDVKKVEVTLENIEVAA
jgi:predicted RNase H-like HicB family nuclease